MTDDIALYIHVPFCRRRCSYCAFTSYPCRKADIPTYVRALTSELSRLEVNRHVRTIYLGGGTPSLLSVEQLGDILGAAHSLFTVDSDAEITMEANPGTVDAAYLAAARGLGINRLSLGVQSLNDRELALLGRIHTAVEVKQAIRCARDAGFGNVNVDLIYGLPSQTTDGWRETLEKALAMRPEHLSLYALSLEAATPLHRAVREGTLPGIDPDFAADQYELAEDLLAAAGYRHYEISNWALAGRECRHNLFYWHNQPYLGAGVAAHSWLGGHRLANTSSLDDYLAAYAGNMVLPPDMDEEIGPETELAETVILGLRLDEGVSVDDIHDRFGIDVTARYGGVIEAMTAAGLLEYTGGRLHLTRRGRLLSNEVFWRFLPDTAVVTPV